MYRAIQVQARYSKSGEIPLVLGLTAFWVTKSAALFPWTSGDSSSEGLCSKQGLPLLAASSRDRISSFFLVSFLDEVRIPLPLLRAPWMQAMANAYQLSIYSDSFALPPPPPVKYLG